MLIRFNYLFCLFLLFLGCRDHYNSNSSEETINIIQKTHSDIYTVRSDTNYTYLKTAEKLILALDGTHDSLMAKNSYLIGLDFINHGKRDSASSYFHKATDYIKGQIKTEGEVDMFYMAWNTYLEEEKFGDCISISNRFKSLIDYEKDLSWLALAHYFDENVYKSTKQYENALKSNELQEDILRKAKDSLGLIPVLLSKAECKYNLKDKKAAFAILDELIEQEERLNNNFKRPLYGNYGLYLFEDGNFKKALPYYLKGIHFTKQMGNMPAKKSQLANGYANIAELYIELKDYRKASAYIDSVRAIGLNNIESRLQLSTLKYELRLAALTNANMKDAFSSLDSSLDSIFDYQKKQYTDKYDNELVALGNAYENEKIILKGKQDAELKSVKLRSRLFLLLGLTLLLAIIGILFFRQRKFKFEKQSLQMQQRLLRSQMNPHFTFNTLYAIQNLIKRDPEGSADYILKFSRLLRLILKNSMQNHVPLEKELESLQKYMDLQLLRFPKKFTYEIDLIDIEEDELLFIPPMLIQPFVENSIEHGFSGIDYKGEIKITLSQNNDFMECCIEDNGLGINKSKKSHKKSTSIALIASFIEKATKTRIEVLNKADISERESGTIIKFSIPFKLTENA